MHTIIKNLCRSKILLSIPLVSLLGLGPIVFAQPIQAKPIDRVSTKPPKGALGHKTKYDERTGYLDKNCKWNNYKHKGVNYRICSMEDILMSVSMDGPPETGDNGPTFYILGNNSFSFRDTGIGTAVIIENGRLVAEVEVGRSYVNTITTRFTPQQRKELTDRALSSKKHLESVGIKWQKWSAARR